jgi:single-strand DNA-binding protein
MASFNKVVLLGNLTRDPEFRLTSGGAPFCKFGLANSRVFNTSDGNRREEVLFVDVDAYGKPAEIIAQYAKKGKMLLVEGRLRYDQWETPAGERRNKLTVVLDSFQFVGGRNEGMEESSGHHTNFEEQVTPPAQRAPAPTYTNAAVEEDIPF